MSLFTRRTRSDTVQQGDVFRKLGTYGGDWVVERIFEYPDIPRHVRLTERNTHRTMTVAADVLFDPTLYTLIETNGTPVGA